MASALQPVGNVVATYGKTKNVKQINTDVIEMQELRKNAVKHVKPINVKNRNILIEECFRHAMHNDKTIT